MKILQIIKNRDKVLGQNARNLLFIQAEKTKAGKKVADDKLLTKQVLSQNHIPTPVLLGQISSYNELEKFDWKSLPKSFVMKPVHGSQGAGIEIFYNNDDQGNWISTNGEKINLEQIKLRAQETIEGKYSISGDPDQVFFEERVKTHKALSNYAYKGAPDIRVVIFNKVPVMSYVRFPTRESRGKANMIQGAVGTGIDLASGITTTSTYGKGKGGQGFPIEYVPGTKLRFQGVSIPYWNKLLFYACEALESCDLKFGAVDFLIDNEKGPLIVELNARPGLSIQIVNRDGLLWRLNKIKGLKIKSTEQGIRIGQDLFGGEIENRIEKISGKEVISNIMPIHLRFGNKEIKTMSLIDTSRRTTVIDAKTALELGMISTLLDENEYEIETIDIRLGTQSFSTNCRIIPEPVKGYKVCIGRNALSNYLIDIKKVEKSNESTLRENTLALIEHTKPSEIDEIFQKISTELNILPSIRPINEKEEQSTFFKKQFDYNPTFLYRPLKFNPDFLLETLDKIKPEDNEIGIIYQNKISEYKYMIKLLESVGVDDEKFKLYSHKLFGSPSKKYQKIAKNILNLSDFASEVTQSYDATQIQEILQKELERISLNFPIKIIKTKSISNKISVGKISGTIKFFATCKRSPDSLKRVIGHELYTHLLRLERASANKYKIFRIGTKRYLKTEEGLANLVGHSCSENKLLSHPALLMHLAYTATKADFQTVFSYAHKYIQDKQRCWNYALRVKRGIKDTAKKGAFTKDLYLKWVLETAQHIIKKPEFIEYAFNGKAHLDELMKFSEPQPIPFKFSVETIKEILNTNLAQHPDNSTRNTLSGI